MMRVLIVDDEAPARRKLRRLLGGEDTIEIVGEAATGAQAVDAIHASRPDVVFLDVQMPGGNGFDVVAAVGPAAMPLVVFVTAFDEHAVRAFEVAAVDYLMKPVSAERFRAAVERVRTRLDAPRDGAPAALAQVLAQAAPSTGPLRHLLVEHGERSVFLPVERIEWAESNRNYVHLHSAGHAFPLRTTLQALVERLDPARFLQLNRSQLVRLDAVREVHPWSHGDQHVVLHDGTRLVWSRRFRAQQDGRFRLG